MREITATAEVWFVYGPDDAAPDLVRALQFLLDDLQADGRVPGRLWLGARALRLGADGLDLQLTLRDGAPPDALLDGVMRPRAPMLPPQPDLTRLHLGRLARGAATSLAIAVKDGEADSDGGSDGDSACAIGRAMQIWLCLLPLIEAAPPRLILWTPGRLLLTPDEVLRAGPGLLAAPGDPDTRFDPARASAPVRPQIVHPMRPVPRTRFQRAERRSARRLFGTPDSAHPPTLPRLEPAQARVSAALRADDAEPPPRPRPRLAATLALAGLWGVLLPRLLADLVPWM